MWLLIALAACDPGAVWVSVDDARLDLHAPVDQVLAPSRAHVPATPLRFEVGNLGDRGVRVFDLAPPPDTVLDAPALPWALDPGDRVAFTLGPVNDTDKVIHGPLVLSSDDPDHPRVEVWVRGSVAPYVQIAEESRPDVDAAVRAEMADQALVGLVVGVARGDTLVFLQGYGEANRELGIPVDPHVTRFRWASLSKGLTGIAATQGWLAGDLSLDDQVSDLLSGYEVPDRVLVDGCVEDECAEALPAASRAMTLRQLLQHSAGAQHYANGTVWPVPPDAEINDPQINTGVSWALDYWVDAPLIAPPGAVYSYSTFGFNLAGAAVEEARGVPFDDLVIQGVARPLSMHSMVADRGWADVPDRATGYIEVGALVLPDGDDDVSWKAPGGGFTSTGADLTRYCAGLLGETVLPAQVRDEVLWAPREPATSYGLGFGLGLGTVSHTGAQQASRTAVLLMPDQDLCFTVMTNSTWASPWRLVTTLSAAWLGDRASAPVNPTPQH